MNRELANLLLKVIDSPTAVEAISKYADMEIEKANNGLQTTTDTVEIYRLQGVIRGMRVLKTVRDQAISTLKK